jgi:hypothetical protein
VCSFFTTHSRPVAASGDANGDGHVNANDLAVWKSQVSTLAAVSIANEDFGRDGAVDGTQFLAWQRNLGRRGVVSSSEGDVDGNGQVDAGDSCCGEIGLRRPSSSKLKWPKRQ